MELNKIKTMVAGTVVNAVHLPEIEYPYYFLNGEMIGWADGADFSNFNPFEILGFTINHHFVEVEEHEVYNAAGREEIQDSVRMAFHSAAYTHKKPFTEVIAAMEEVHPLVVIGEAE